MGKVLEGLETQHSNVAVVDSELFDLEVPANRQKELRTQAQSVKTVLVAGKSSRGKSQLFQGSV